MTEDRLRKVLELERSKRFSDRAVTAGLDSFLKHLTTHEGSQLSSDVFAQIQRLPVAGYRSLTPPKRREWLEALLSSLKGAAGGRRSPQSATGPTPTRRPSSSLHAGGEGPGVRPGPGGATDKIGRAHV